VVTADQIDEAVEIFRAVLNRVQREGETC
jgi:hypothetical protein